MTVRRRHQRHKSPDPIDPEQLVNVMVRIPAKARAKARRLAQANNTSLAGLLTDLLLSAPEPPALVDDKEAATSAA